jgi:hypothetical protein
MQSYVRNSPLLQQPRRGTVYGVRSTTTRRNAMSVGMILLIILILILVGVIPAWPHSRGWGVAPGGLVGVLLIILIIMLLMGKI